MTKSYWLQITTSRGTTNYTQTGSTVLVEDWRGSRTLNVSAHEIDCVNGRGFVQGIKELYSCSEMGGHVSGSSW